MPVPHLDLAVAELGVTHREPVSALRGARLAVDAPYWIRRILKRLPQQEPLLEATGGVPAALGHAVERELKAAMCARAPSPLGCSARGRNVARQAYLARRALQAAALPRALSVSATETPASRSWSFSLA